MYIEIKIETLKRKKQSILKILNFNKHWSSRSAAMSDTSEAPSLASHVRRVRVPSQGWKLLSCSHSQESGQRYDIAPDWPHESEELIRSLVCLLTKLLTMTAIQKFPLQASDVDQFLDDLFMPVSIEAENAVLMRAGWYRGRKYSSYVCCNVENTDAKIQF